VKYRWVKFVGIAIGDCGTIPYIIFNFLWNTNEFQSIGVPVGETVNISYFLSIPYTKSWIANLQDTQHNNKSWQLKKNKYFMFQNITL